jgi:hypothetical protein
MAAFALLMVLFNQASPSQSVIYFPSADLCEAGAKQIMRDIPGQWRYTCVPVVGSATR